MRRRVTGMGLTEVLVAASVLLIMLGLATLAVLAYLRGTHQLVAQTMPADEVARGLERSARILRSAQTVVAPTRAELVAGYRPELGARPPLVMRVRTSSGYQFVGLTTDPQAHRLLALRYGETFDPNQPPPAGVELGPATSCIVRLNTGSVLELQLGAQATQVPWLTSVAWAAVVFP